MVDRNSIRQKNVEILQQILFEMESAFKTELAQQTNISTVTINSIVNELMDKNIFLEGPLVQKDIGRPAIRYSFNYDAQHYLLLSVQEKLSEGSTKPLQIISKIVNMKGEEKLVDVLDFHQVELNAFLEILLKYINAGYEISSIGISLPGKIHEGIVISSWYDKFNEWNIEKELHKQVDVPVNIQNDAHLMTIGYALKHHLLSDSSLIGIYYPEQSMPGITIFMNDHLYEGNKSLAGEAKYLPMFLNKSTPQNTEELASNLAEVVAIYNTVLSPKNIVVSSDHMDEKKMKQKINHHPAFVNHPNEPAIYYEENFQDSIFMGLRWLVHKDTLYELS